MNLVPWTLLTSTGELIGRFCFTELDFSVPHSLIRLVYLLKAGHLLLVSGKTWMHWERNSYTDRLSCRARHTGDILHTTIPKWCILRYLWSCHTTTCSIKICYIVIWLRTSLHHCDGWEFQLQSLTGCMNFILWLHFIPPKSSKSNRSISLNWYLVISKQVTNQA